MVDPDECDIYSRLGEWGHGHRSGCHSAGEFARQEDGDGSCGVHVDMQEGFWSRLRS